MLSVCAAHPPDLVETATNGVLHLTEPELAALRQEAAAHISTCGRGPIRAVRVHVIPEGRSAAAEGEAP